MARELSLYEQALAALDQAAQETSGPERYRLMEEALRLHRLARSRGEYPSPGKAATDGEAPRDGDSDGS